MIALGAACVAKAQTATTFSILALGWILAISGVVWLVGALQTWTWGGFFVYLLNAIIRGVTGYLLIRHPDAGAAAVTTLLAALFIVGGRCSAPPQPASFSSPAGDGRCSPVWFLSHSAFTYLRLGLLPARTSLES